MKSISQLLLAFFLVLAIVGLARAQAPPQDGAFVLVCSSMARRIKARARGIRTTRATYQSASHSTRVTTKARSTAVLLHCLKI
jgi:hypothetical protein